jgi:hypothetical protein
VSYRYRWKTIIVLASFIMYRYRYYLWLRLFSKKKFRINYDLVEGLADVAQVLPDHLLAKPLPGDEEPSHGRRRVVQESLTINQLRTFLVAL